MAWAVGCCVLLFVVLASLIAAYENELRSMARWLDDYFSGGQPDFTPPLHLIGSAFRLRVWARLLEIPYGQTTTYGALLGDGASARAVGGAVGRNPISIIVPCHRVIGADGSLTGYAGGIERKIVLLCLEGADTARFRIPKKGTAL